MRKPLFKTRSLAAVALTLLMAASLPSAAFAQTKEQAARDAARQYDAKVLSVKEQKQGQDTVYVIKLLTRDGVVKTVRVTKRR
jgi:ketopantoate hydroxymethyltransferase